MDTRKRFQPEAFSNGGFKKSKQELDSSGVGSKLKPCTKFFSIAGCPFGDSCHFLHYFPGGYSTVAKLMNLSPTPVSRNVVPQSPMPNGSSSSVKSKLCSRYNSAEGCKFGDMCYFAHGEWELGRPVALHDLNPRNIGAIPGRFGGRMQHSPPAVPGAASFGASSTAKISVDASLAGAIIGKAGVNSKQISRQTGVKLAIRDHESDTSLKNIELEGTFEQISQASSMVKDLILSIGLKSDPAKASGIRGGVPTPRMNNYKTKLCENFTKGSCTFGEKCHFAHGEAELQKSGV